MFQCCSTAERRGEATHCRVLEQAVEGVEHLVRQEEEELSRKSSVVESVLALELDHEALLEVVRRLAHDLGVAVLEDVRAADLDVALAGRRTEGGLRAEVDELAAEVALVLRHVLVERRGQARVVPGRRLGAAERATGELLMRNLKAVTHLWSTKYTRAVLVRRISHPDGSGPSCETDWG